MSTYTIKEVSQQFQLPASTLRYYEEIGLLTNIKRQGQRRIYEEYHLHRLGAICCFKETGMSMAQLKTFFDCEDVTGKEAEVITLLTEHSQEVDEQINSLIKNRQHIQRKLAYYQARYEALAQEQDLPNWQDYTKMPVTPPHID